MNVTMGLYQVTMGLYPLWFVYHNWCLNLSKNAQSLHWNNTGSHGQKCGSWLGKIKWVVCWMVQNPRTSTNRMIQEGFPTWSKLSARYNQLPPQLQPVLTPASKQPTASNSHARRCCAAQRHAHALGDFHPAVDHVRNPLDTRGCLNGHPRRIPPWWG